MGIFPFQFSISVLFSTLRSIVPIGVGVRQAKQVDSSNELQMCVLFSKSAFCFFSQQRGQLFQTSSNHGGMIRWCGNQCKNLKCIIHMHFTFSYTVYILLHLAQYGWIDLQFLS